ncbi:hypothetical protein D043_2422B, partial [Vibrio parahaemolyticus EKP-021]
VCTPFR